MVKMAFCRCRCYLTDNVFLNAYRLHVNFRTKSQFLKDYGQAIRDAGCDTQDKLNAVFSEIDAEIERRATIDVASDARRRQIAERYVPLHSDVYNLCVSHLAPEFLRLVELCQRPGTDAMDVTKFISEQFQPETSKNEAQLTEQRIYSVPVFTDEFCQRFLEEIVHFEASDLPKGRPNTMNNYGILLNEMGFDERFLTPLRRRFLQPMSAVLFPEWGGDDLDSHRAFVVTYKHGEDEDLAYHYDNAEVTLNVCLGEDFSGGDLYFGNMWDECLDAPSMFTSYAHQRTRGLLHRGRHRHGAAPIQDGSRYNLIVWMRSSRIRNSLCPMCRSPPVPVPSLGFDDGFTLPSAQPSIATSKKHYFYEISSS